MPFSFFLISLVLLHTVIAWNIHFLQWKGITLESKFIFQLDLITHHMVECHWTKEAIWLNAELWGREVFCVHLEASPAPWDQGPTAPGGGRSHFNHPHNLSLTSLSLRLGCSCNHLGSYREHWCFRPTSRKSGLIGLGCSLGRGIGKVP